MLRKWTVKELIFRTYKEVLKFNIYTKNPLIKKEKYLNAYLHISPTNIYIYIYIQTFISNTWKEAQ